MKFMKLTDGGNFMKTLKTFIGLSLVAFNLMSADPKLNVVATLPDLGAVASEIGGERIKLTVIAGANEDPHFVDARPSFLRVLNQADVLIENGGELEAGWLPPLVSSARNKKILGDSPGHILAITGVKLLDVPVGKIDRSEGDVHPYGNPHFMLDPENCLIVASNITAAFSRIDSQGTEYYQQNLKTFSEKMLSKIPQWKKTMEPFAGIKVITYHKSFDYLINYFNLVLYDTIEPKPGIEPSPSHISNLIKRAKQENVRLVIIEPNRPKKTPTEVCKATGAKLLILPLMPGGGNSPKDFIGWYDYIIKTLSESLKN